MAFILLMTLREFHYQVYMLSGMESRLQARYLETTQLTHSSNPTAWCLKLSAPSQPVSEWNTQYRIKRLYIPSGKYIAQLPIWVYRGPLLIHLLWVVPSTFQVVYIYIKFDLGKFIFHSHPGPWLRWPCVSCRAPGRLEVATWGL